jgi:competence protein ComEC
VILLAASVFFFLRGRDSLARAVATIVIAMAAAMNLQSGGVSPSSDDSALRQLSDGREVSVVAHVIRDGLLKEASAGRPRQTVDVETEEIQDGTTVMRSQVGLRLTVYPSKAPSGEEAENENSSPGRFFRYGERLRFAAKLREPRNYLNPGAFDYRGFLAEQGITLLTSVPAQKIELLPGFSGSRLGWWRSRLRGSLLQRIRVLWREPDAALMAAMLLGDRSGVDHELTRDYQRTGAYHILVVAGLKVGILAVALLWLLRRLLVPDWVATFITIALCAVYALITEANPPVVRATVMLAIYLMARLFYRQRNPLNAVGAAALGILAWQPRALFDASFQLTFVSLLAIAGIALPIFERTSQPLRRALRNFDSRDYDFALSPKLVQFRLDLRLIAERLARWLGRPVAQWAMIGGWRMVLGIYDVLLLSAVLQIAVAPLMAFYFHRAVILGLPANALVVPLHALLLPLAGAALLASYLSVPMATILAAVPGSCLHATNTVVERLAHWHPAGFAIADMRVATPTVIATAIAAGTFVLLICALRWKKLAAPALLALTATSVATCFSASPHLRAGSAEITAIDVGQGDSLLVISPAGRTLLIDAGGELGPPGAARFDIGEEVVSSYLWARGLTRLDAVALTHAHVDHIGGMRSVLANFHPRELWIGPAPNTAPVRDLLQTASTEGVTVIRRHDHEQFDFAGLRIEILGPPDDWQVASQKAQNNDSLVMRVSLGNTSALLEGDAEKKIERELVTENPSAQLLKVAHHGSASSTIPELLAATHPQFAVISVGYRNAFHHPRSEVLDRLQQAGVTTFRTDTMGATTFYLDGKQITSSVAAQPEQ